MLTAWLATSGFNIWYTYWDRIELSTDSNARATHLSRARDDNVKKGNASGNSECSKRNNMETLAQGENFEGKDATSQEKGSTENRDGKTEVYYFKCGLVNLTIENSHLIFINLIKCHVMSSLF